MPEKHVVLLYVNFKRQFELNKEFPTEDLITGKLYLRDSIEQAMKTMEVVAGLQYRINGNKISIERKNK